MAYFDLKFLHIIGSAVLLGTGAGIAFFMVMAHRSKDVAVIAGVARIVVIADFVFTATAVIVQPITGILLADVQNYPLTSSWIVASLVLYVFIGMWWLPVVYFQIRIRDIAAKAVAENRALPADYYWYYRVWFAFGFPAFFSVLLIFWLMIARPQLW
ncbi:MAG: DUF2269 domain-containing protein [Xanthobacteraceae bacterium]|jgi:uncharacterized membrane protein|nr:DUF2269 domain-containing protein [Xanthobacteraceae bacterium]